MNPASPFRRSSVSEPRAYDFRTPEGLDRSHLRFLHNVFDIYVRLAGGVLTGALRMPVHVAVSDIRQTAWDDFARNSESPAHLVVFSMAPLPAKCIMYLPLDLSMGMVDVRLSGPGDGWYPKRPLTEIEEVLLAPIVDSLLNEMGNALGHYLPVNMAVNQKAADTDLLQAVISSGFCVVVEMEVRFGDGAAFMMAICLPFPVVRPIVEAIEKSELALTADPDEPDPALLAQLLRVPVELSVRFSSTRLSPPEIRDLAPGDVIPLHHPPGAPLSLVAGGLPRLSVLPTSVGRHLAAVVVDPAMVGSMVVEEGEDPYVQDEDFDGPDAYRAGPGEPVPVVNPGGAENLRSSPLGGLVEPGRRDEGGSDEKGTS